jgi:hypothetical protein
MALRPMTLQHGGSSGTSDVWAPIDGSLNAPVIAAGAQFPTLLNAYGGTGVRNRNIGTPFQPPWRVPGVDYAVGINDSARPLRSVTGGGLPAGASYASNTVTITGNNVTLDGWDFSVSGGVNLDIVGDSATIKNCFFQAGVNMTGDAILVEGGGNTLIEYCEFNGTGSSFPPSLCVAMPITDGTVTCMYNYIHHWNDDSFRVESFDNPTGAPQNRRFIIKYNVMFSNGYTGVHNDQMQTVNASFTLLDMSFNLMYQPTPVGGLPTETTGFRNSDLDFAGCECQGGHATYNVYIGKGSPSNITFSQIFAISGTTSGTNHFAAVHDNYIDGTGLQNTASVFTTAGQGQNPVQVLCVTQHDNWDMAGVFPTNSHNPTGYLTSNMTGGPEFTRPNAPTLSTATKSGANVAVTGTVPAVPTGGFSSPGYLVQVWALDLPWQNSSSIGTLNGLPTTPFLVDWTHIVAPGGSFSFTTAGQTLPAGNHTIAVTVTDYGNNPTDDSLNNWNMSTYSNSIAVTI